MDSILFLHHKPLDSGITGKHLALLKTLNPDMVVIPISFMDKIKHKAAWNHSDHWRSSNQDILIYEWFEREQPKFERYFLIEWDTFCTQPLKEFYGTSYHRSCVGAAIVNPESGDFIPGQKVRMKDWKWFSFPVSPCLRKFARGIVPTSGTMLSHDALSGMVSVYRNYSSFKQMQAENQVGDLDQMQNECRVGTLASMAGFEPERIREDAHLFLFPSLITQHQELGIWHKVIE